MTYLFIPETGVITGNGIRKYHPDIPLGNHISRVQEMSYVYDPEDNLKIMVEFTRYVIPNVRRQELGKTLEWFASAPQKDIEKYKKKLKLNPWGPMDPDPYE